MEERKYFIDNLRWISILLLFPFHASQIWNGGEYSGFYIWSHTDNFMYIFSTAVYPWFMTLLFVLAGMSCRYALKTRTNKQFIGERTKRLLIPFIFGVLFLVPIMTYIGEIYFNGYTGDYIAQYILFFTKPTDLTGYKGGFTPGHLWFLIYLFVIALLALMFIRLQKKYMPNPNLKIPSYFVLLLIFLPEWLAQYIMNIAGKSIGQFLFLYLLGYYLLTDENVLKKIKKYRLVSITLWLSSGIFYTYLYCFANFRGILCTGLYVLFGWLGILALLGFGQAFLDYTNNLFKYFRTASYSIYIIHQPVLVVTGYFVLRLKIEMILQFFLIVLISFSITIFIYELVKRIPIICTLFGAAKKERFKRSQKRA